MGIDIENHSRIKLLLKAKRITFAQIADELSVSASAVTMVSQGRRSSETIATAIAGKLDLPVAELWDTPKKGGE